MSRRLVGHMSGSGIARMTDLHARAGSGGKCLLADPGREPAQAAEMPTGRSRKRAGSGGINTYWPVPHASRLRRYKYLLAGPGADQVYRPIRAGQVQASEQD